MKTILLILIVLFSFSCSKKQYKSHATKNDSTGISDGSFQKDPASLEVVSSASEEMVRFSTEYDSHITEGLKELSDSNVFSFRHDQLISELDRKHQLYFIKKPEYELLFYSNGALFQNGSDDGAFIIYDKHKQLISISVYNDLSNDYSLMYMDLNVEFGLNSDECDYYSSRSLDYLIASELVWLKDSFIKNPGSLSEYSMCEIGDITNNQNIVIERGCFSKDYDQNNSLNCLCVGTSLIYNNWECLKYDKDRNIFIVFYGQAFAD